MYSVCVHINILYTEDHDGGLFGENLEVSACHEVDALDLLAAMHEEVGRRDVQHLEFHAQRPETPYRVTSHHNCTALGL